MVVLKQDTKLKSYRDQMNNFQYQGVSRIIFK